MGEFMLGLIEMEKSLLGTNPIIINQGCIFFEWRDGISKVYLAFVPIKPKDNIYEGYIEHASMQAIIGTFLLAHNALVSDDKSVMTDLYKYFGKSGLDYTRCYSLCEAMLSCKEAVMVDELQMKPTLIEKKKL